MTPTSNNIKNIILLAALAFFCWLMLKIVLLYIPIRTDVAFLQLKQAYIHIDVWRIAFFTHVFTSIFALAAGFTQFSKTLLRKKPKLHRTIGYIYVIDIIFITGPSGLIMSYYANGGITSQIAFTILSVLWILFTAIAVRKAIKKDFTTHKKFMIRSYALTLSAISLRTWKVVLAKYTHLGPMDRYRIIAWLGWGLNLLIAEIIIAQQLKKKSLQKKGLQKEIIISAH